MAFIRALLHRAAARDMFGSDLPGGSFHNDVLLAEPSDEASKEALLEELKKRAKGSLASKNYPEAIQLYSKGIEIFPDDAILYANRSMCHLGMNNGSGALEDAVKATAKDPSYAKGYYRKGMSELKLNRLSDAKASFLAGVALVPDDKSFRDQLDKLNAVGANTSSPAPVSKPSAAAKPSSKPVGSANNKPATDTTEVDNEQVGGVFRGYKKTSDGRTTTFFNNELDETTKALIGDIAPKKLDAPDVPAVVPAPAAAGSVWNTAGTFEERICTPWAQSRLEELFTDMQVDALPLDSVISLTKSAFSGDAAITRNRGKVKHVYDFTATCEWKLTVMESSSVPESCCGTIVMNDITGDKDYEFEVTVDSAKKRPSHEAAGMIDSHIKRGRLQQQMVAACNTFHEEFNAKL